MMRIYVRNGDTKEGSHSFTGTINATIAFLDRTRFTRGHEVQITLPNGRTLTVRKVPDLAVRNVLELVHRNRPHKPVRLSKPRIRVVTVNGKKVSTPTTVPFSMVNSAGRISIHFPSHKPLLKAAS